MPLDADFIAELLEKERNKATGIKQSVTGGPRPVQLGPLRWFDTTDRCSSRGCGSPTLIKVRGIPYCTSHALNELNRIILSELELVDLSRCTCKAGVHSKGNIHTADCDMYHAQRPLLSTELDMDNLL